MKSFQMCPECQTEYEDPGNRRFHAEPNACPVCGPVLWAADSRGRPLPETDPVTAAAAALREGRIVALKGLGGFQLACLATDHEAVSRLRERKRRPHKPFAVMIASLDDAALHGGMSNAEKQMLASVERPIVLLDRLRESDIDELVAPGLRQLGIMLPCSPLHYLLAREVQQPLVMTSGNLSEEPICRTNTEARSRLGGIADLFLFHDRKIVSTYDDSVAMVVDDEPILIRRARGYAPLPIELPFDCGEILAVGGEQKNTFCLTRGRNAFLSQHIGDLTDADTLLGFERTEALYERLFRLRPDYLTCDSHPDYISTAYSRERDPAPIRVQHHRAHIASCLAENGFADDVVGVALDGTGFGDDGTIWGGEFFVGSLEGNLVRAAHLANMPLLGGEAAIREPWRMALAATWEFSTANVGFAAALLEIPDQKLDLLLRQLEAGLNCPRTSSCGRLFDAVAALVLKQLTVSYDAQAAIELEAAASEFSQLESSGQPLATAGSAGALPEARHGSYKFMLDRGVNPWVISPAMVLSGIFSDLEAGEPREAISFRFHDGLAEAIVQTCTQLAKLHGLTTIALSGGVFQNRLLLTLVRNGLLDQGLKVLMHRLAPSNDGGISLGQAVIAGRQKTTGKKDTYKAETRKGSEADVPGDTG